MKATKRFKSIIKLFTGQNIEEALKSRDGFVDTIFPPSQESLFNNISEIPDEQRKYPKFVKDKKRQMLTKENYALRRDKYDWSKLNKIKNVSRLNMFRETKNMKDDIVQGELGNNNFLSVLISLLENDKSNIKRIINPGARGSDGAFESKVFINGEPVPVILDDQFPVSSTNKLAFCGINDSSGNIWPIVIEKAWAKCNKTYENIISGNATESLEFLTPAPIDTFPHEEEDNNYLLENIKMALNNKYIVLADTNINENANVEKLAKLGLITNHAYQVIDTANIKNPNGDDIQLLKLKNLLGKNEWSGDWSDNSLKWTQEAIDHINLEKKEDGIFWMSFNDYLQFYSCTHICHLNPNYNYNFVKNKVYKQRVPNPYNLSKIVVNKPGKGYFVVNLKSTRIYQILKNNPNYENPSCSMEVFTEGENGQLIYIGNDFGKKDRLYVKCDNIKKGNYYVSVSFTNKDDTKDFSISNEVEVYDKNLNYRVGLYSNLSNQDYKFDQLSPREKNEKKNYILNLIKQETETNENKIDFALEGEPDSWRVISLDNDRRGYGYIQYKNNSDAFLKEKLKFLKLKNISIIPFIEEGYFMQEEQVKKYKKRVVNPNENQNKHQFGSNRIHLNENDKQNEEVEYESDTIISVINNLKGEKLQSSYTIVNDEDKSPEEKDIPLIVQLSIAPHSSCTILLKKNDFDIDFDYDSDICFEYLPNIYFGEQRFPQKKYRLKYNDRPVEVYECVTEHNTGIFFQYKNRTTNLRLKVIATFNNYENLYLNLTSSDLNENHEVEFKKYVKGQFRDDNDSNVVEIEVNPFETGFFGLNSIDKFKKFSYSCDFQYHFSLAK
jgi:hypothetical protein